MSEEKEPLSELLSDGKHILKPNALIMYDDNGSCIFVKQIPLLTQRIAELEKEVENHKAKIQELWIRLATAETQLGQAGRDPDKVESWFLDALLAAKKEGETASGIQREAWLNAIKFIELEAGIYEDDYEKSRKEG